MAAAKTLEQLFNQALNMEEFPNNLKNENVTPVLKNPLNEKNFRLATVLSIISKVFEKQKQNQINLLIKSFLSPYLHAMSQ